MGTRERVGQWTELTEGEEQGRNKRREKCSCGSGQKFKRKLMTTMESRLKGFKASGSGEG